MVEVGAKHSSMKCSRYKDLFRRIVLMSNAKMNERSESSMSTKQMFIFGLSRASTLGTVSLFNGFRLTKSGQKIHIFQKVAVEVFHNSQSHINHISIFNE